MLFSFLVSIKAKGPISRRDWGRLTLDMELPPLARKLSPKRVIPSFTATVRDFIRADIYVHLPAAELDQR